MADYITLSCPSCGGKLEITQDIERFACAYCGQEHIVKRGGGIVSLSPVVEGLKKVEIGVDKTAAELAIERLQREIVPLINEKNKLLKINPYPKEYSLFLLLISGTLGVLLIIMSVVLFASSWEEDKSVAYCLLASGIVFTLIGMEPIIFRDPKKLKVKKFWEETTGVKINKLDEQIESIQLELEHNKKLVSQ